MTLQLPNQSTFHLFTIQLILFVFESTADQSCTSTNPKGSSGVCVIDQTTAWVPPPSPSPTGNFVCDPNYWDCRIDCNTADTSTYGACSGYAFPPLSMVVFNSEIHCPSNGPISCQSCRVNCSTNHACSGVTIYSYDCSEVRIHLDGIQTDLMIVAGSGTLQVTTNDTAQISSSHIDAFSSDTNELIVDCTQGTECDIDVRGDGVHGTLHYICDGQQDCSGVNIYCPNDVLFPVTGECDIDCNSANANGGCKDMNVRAIEGTYDVNWFCSTDTSSNCNGAQLTCGQDLDIQATWTYTAHPAWRLSLECSNSPNPTASPSDSTAPPTTAPSSRPTYSPSVAPSFAPSVAPTSPPTAAPVSVCSDYAENSNDGTNELAFDASFVLNLNDYYPVKDSVFTEFITTDIDDYAGESIDCTNRDCLVKCMEKASCLGAMVDITNGADETAVIYCEQSYSCAIMSIVSNYVASSENTRANITVLCVDKNACNDMDIVLTDFTSFTLHCIASLACNHVNITIHGDGGYTKDNDGVISCVNPNSCDDLFITTTSNQTQLMMHEYSQDVVLDNGIGYLYNDGNIICNNDRYIRIETSQITTDQNVSDLIHAEYMGDLLPCEGLQVSCGDHSCHMQYNQRSLTGIAAAPGCVWLNVQNIQNIVCEGSCIGSPTSPPTASPTDMPTIRTSEPTTAPSAAPTRSPISPPSVAPSFSPTAKPTTGHPTNSPSATPSQSPSLPPSVSPTQSPTNNPTSSPTSKPTVTPSTSPSNAPSSAPTQSPTRIPTVNFEEIYDSFISIIYIIGNLNDEYIELLEDDTLNVVPYIIEIIESHYFVGQHVVEYKDFMLRVNAVNNFADLSNINLRPNQDVRLNGEILAESTVIGLLLKTSESSEFAEQVTADLNALFTNNTDLQFYVENRKTLKISTNDDDVEQRWEIVYASAIIVAIGALLSILVFLLNKSKSSNVDNAKWRAPLLFALQVWDFISDVNLSYTILSNVEAYDGTSRGNIIFWCGVSSVVFTALPFISNLFYGIGIKRQKVITNNKRADEYFTANMAIFIALTVISGGCYPALIMVSSSIFALNAFQSGLTKHELNKLSKIKIKSTITCENVPQLIVQIIYATQTKTIETAVLFAFVGSLLSVIMAVSSYMANKQSRKDSDIMSYYLRFYKANEEEIDETYKHNIKKKKGRKQGLTREIANSLGISKDNLEIGYVWILNNGLEMHLSHYLSKSELSKHTKNVRGYKSEITPQQYLVDTYRNTKHKQSINEKFRKHFNIEDKQFIVEFKMDNAGFETSDAEDGDTYHYKSVATTHGSGQIVEMHRMMEMMMQHMNINNDKLEIEYHSENVSTKM